MILNSKVTHDIDFSEWHPPSKLQTYQLTRNHSMNQVVRCACNFTPRRRNVKSAEEFYDRPPFLALGGTFGGRAMR